MGKTKLMRRARACAWVSAVAGVALAWGGARAAAQGEAQKGGAPATVVGRVTDGKRGLAGVAVMLTPDAARPWEAESVHAKTDAEGRYRAAGLAPGRYRVTPIAPAHVVAEGAERSKTLLLAAGETVENVDFPLVRGGVITGRVTGADGRPLVGEFVRVTVEAGAQPAHAAARPDRTELSTDDRGVYRVYGLPAGSYRVSVGADGPPRGPRGTTTSGEKTFNQRTYYPGTTVAAEARPVEVTEGGETTGIDFSVAKATRQTYAVAGRVVFAETGQPAANVRVGWSTAAGGGGGRMPLINYAGPAGSPGGVVTDSRGEFKLEGFTSGRYVAFGVREGAADWYSELSGFEVADAAAEGVEVKLRRGGSISGVVQLEGVADRATAARLLGRARLFAYSESPGGGPPNQPGSSLSTTINPDGTFRVTGMQPGRVRLNLSDRETGVVLLRVEHNGASADRGIEVAEGAQVTGVRVVAGQGSAVVRGQINVTGGTLEPGTSLRVFVRRLGGDGAQGTVRVVEADSRGLFVVENLVAGEYELNAGAWPGAPRGPGGGPGGGGPRGNGLAGPRQRLTVAPGGEHQVTLVLPAGQNANPNINQ